MVAQNIFFYVIAAVIVAAALRVVTTKNVVHAALYLVVVLAGVGAQYLLLAAEFVAAVQVLVYIGAVIVLFLFGIMLTRAPIGREHTLTNDQWWLGAFVALILFAVMAGTLVDGFEDTELPDDPRLAALNVPASVIDEGAIEVSANLSNTAVVSDSIFSTYLVPFEVVSVLLLAALVGAIVIARKD